MKASSYFATFKQLDYLKNDINMIFTSPKKKQILLSFVGVAQKMPLPYPFEVLNSFGGKSMLRIARNTRFGGKLNTYECSNW